MLPVSTRWSLRGLYLVVLIVATALIIPFSTRSDTSEESVHKLFIADIEEQSFTQDECSEGRSCVLKVRTETWRHIVRLRIEGKSDSWRNSNCPRDFSVVDSINVSSICSRGSKTYYSSRNEISINFDLKEARPSWGNITFFYKSVEKGPLMKFPQYFSAGKPYDSSKTTKEFSANAVSRSFTQQQCGGARECHLKVKTHTEGQLVFVRIDSEFPPVDIYCSQNESLLVRLDPDDTQNEYSVICGSGMRTYYSKGDELVLSFYPANKQLKFTATYTSVINPSLLSIDKTAKATAGNEKIKTNILLVIFNCVLLIFT